MPDDNHSARSRRTVEPSEGQETYLGPNSTLEGKLIVEGDLVVHGRVSGELHSAGVLRVESGAQVEAVLAAERVSIRGDVTGNVTAAGGLALRDPGSLNGDVEAGALTVEEGALLNGRVIMRRPGAAAERRRGAEARREGRTEAAAGEEPVAEAAETADAERETAGART